MRNYQTKTTMFVDRFTQEVVQPDTVLVLQLHRLLDMLPRTHALAIDHTVAELLRFKNPNQNSGIGTVELIQPEAKS